MSLPNSLARWFPATGIQRLRPLIALLSVVGYAAAEEGIDFTRDIRPLLSDRCFGCHGPGDQKADLRLDTFEGATDWAVVPGDADESEVIARVLLEDDDELRMPPIHSGKERLTPEEVDLIRRWIESGAEYKGHWSFEPMPEANPEARRDGVIDERVGAELKKEGLAFSPEADPRTLLRRVTLDLTGLPPTPEEIEEFLADNEAGAYERAVDRLLASPRYGEHAARFWLDAVRYGDTHGKHYDNVRGIWHYRDWVVRAMNANKPYDEFLVEQIAGDLLPNPTIDQQIASGFNRCNVTTAEGGTIPKEIYTDNVRDRTDTFGTAVLGMTVACAKCHDHKYDPITQKDYYSLFAFFNSLDGDANDRNRVDPPPTLAIPTPGQEEKLAKLEHERESLEGLILRDERDLEDAQAVWERGLAALADPAACEALLAKPLVKVGEWRGVGPFYVTQTWQVEKFPTPPEKAKYDPEQTWHTRTGGKMGWTRRPEWVGGHEIHRLPGGMSINLMRTTLTVDEPTKVVLEMRSDDTLKVKLNGKEVHNFGGKRGIKDIDEIELDLKAGENVLFVRVGNHKGGDSAFSYKLRGAVFLPREAIAAVSTPEAERTDEQRLTLRESFRWRYGANADLAAHRKSYRSNLVAEDTLLREFPTTLVFIERKKPRPAFVLERGDYDKEGDPVERSTPGFLPPMDESLPRDRLGLARWATDPEHPLTSRVAVNRFWQQFFGVGLTKTSGDVGSQGEPPSHPELLDQLAADFVADGWDVKRLARRIVLSRTYRQASAAPVASWKSDPENRLLARGPRRRLDGEVLRDQALAVSGLLVNRLGGKPVRPPQPDGLWKAVAYVGSNTGKFVADKGPDKVHRRSIYTFHKRTAPPPQMVIFDGPSRESCQVRRELTNTPLQALTLMNDPQYVEAARALAERSLRESSEDNADRAGRMLALVTGRPASQEEVAELVAAVEEELAYYRDHPESAAKLIAIGAMPPDKRWEAPELAAWTMAANLALNLDEVVCKN